MKKHQREREAVNEEFNKPTSTELDKLRSSMEAKQQVRMNGRLQSRFFQVMFDWEVLRLLEDGRISVKNPSEYTKWNRANAMIEAADWKQQDSYFNAYPEERAKWNANVARWISETREMLKLVNRNTKITSQPTVEN